MKCVILAGGFGTRLSEETELKPKPMVEIGGRPILWHIIKHYSFYGVNEFIICCGYKGHIIKDYFVNYFTYTSDFTVDLETNSINYHNSKTEPWKITCADTGGDTMTGGRIKRIKHLLQKEETICLTYGDGLSDLNIKKLIDFHHSHQKEVTITTSQVRGRFGMLQVSKENIVQQFIEKPKVNDNWINAGFFVLNSKAIDRISDDTTVWEQEPLAGLAADRELAAYCHKGFWQPMDTLREKKTLCKLWDEGNAPWKIW